jgi:hypothetical protein
VGNHNSSEFDSRCCHMEKSKSRKIIKTYYGFDCPCCSIGTIRTRNQRAQIKRSTEKEIREEMMDKIKYGKIPGPEDCAFMSLKDFVYSVECFSFVDDDGVGYYATKDKMSNLIAQPSAIKKGIINKNFTHVVWFNK